MESGDLEIYARVRLAAVAIGLAAVVAEISGPDGVRAREVEAPTAPGTSEGKCADDLR
jgi:hypothetical protein